MRLTQAQAGYMAAGPGNAFRCGDCVFFVAGGACERVSGAIDPDLCCNLYQGPGGPINPLDWVSGTEAARIVGADGISAGAPMAVGMADVPREPSPDERSHAARVLREAATREDRSGFDRALGEGLRAVAAEVDARPGGPDRLRCFLNGVELGDSLEDVQQLTEDLLEHAGASADGFTSLESSLVNAWADVRDSIISEGVECGFADPRAAALVRSVDHLLGRAQTGNRVAVETVKIARRNVDELTQHLARRVVVG